MPILNLKRWSVHRFASSDVSTRAGRSISGASSREASGRRSLLDMCANPHCRSGWFHLWRNRSAPVFEGGWTCCRDCTEDRVASAVRREMDGRNWDTRAHIHRIPLGLVMLEQGWISHAQLREALAAQRAAGHGLLGWWLVQQRATSDQIVARALALQWSCPMLIAESAEASFLTSALPRLFVDAFAALPLRVAAGQILYLGFESRPDPVLALGIEQITGLRVESGIVSASGFAQAQQRILQTAFPRVELIEASHIGAAARAMARALERVQPVESRLARIHDCLWLRMWTCRRSGPLTPLDEIDDLICSIGAS